jgi:hypothetical protein
MWLHKKPKQSKNSSCPNAGRPKKSADGRKHADDRKRKRRSAGSHPRTLLEEVGARLGPEEPELEDG